MTGNSAASEKAPPRRSPSRHRARAALAYEAVGPGVPPVVLPCRLELCWIEVQMFDEDDRPLAGEP